MTNAAKLHARDRNWRVRSEAYKASYKVNPALLKEFVLR